MAAVPPCRTAALEKKQWFSLSSFRALLPGKCKGSTIHCTCRGWGTWPAPSHWVNKQETHLGTLQSSCFLFKTSNCLKQGFPTNLKLWNFHCNLNLETVTRGVWMTQTTRNGIAQAVKKQHAADICLSFEDDPMSLVVSCFLVPWKYVLHTS